MRFFVDTKDRMARKSKQLKKMLGTSGYDVKLTKCQALMAQMLGYRDWQELCRCAGAVETSPGDDSVDERERERRREQHIQVLLTAGIEGEDAEMVVDAVGPTRYHSPPADVGGERAREDMDEEPTEFEEEWGLRPSPHR